MTTQNKSDQYEFHLLEMAVNRCGLQTVLETLVEICHLKAEHLAVDWQDTTSAKVWTQAAMRISVTAHTQAVKGVS